MERTLGLDLGTNSIGWAIVERTGDEEYELLDKGVDIFREGVAREKNSEKPAVQERTAARALRRHYFRRRLRKIKLLRLLVREKFCPPLSDEQLMEWRRKKTYPLDEDFIRWQRTDDGTDENPYRDRYRALTERLDLSTCKDRHALGRALYHLNQRRGFLSNRKQADSEQEQSKVKEGIEALSTEMKRAGCSFLGEYFYHLYRRKEKIRTVYTSRNEHYLAEFNAICDRQELPPELRKELREAIFFQRKLKSQKGSVGRCTFEKNKSRCPVSHPRFEEFRMYSFINSIRVSAPGEGRERPLEPQEIEKIRPLFLRKSKPHFDFREIAEKIAGKGRGRYACKGDRIEAPYRFNFSGITTVTGCPVTAALAALFPGDWLSDICTRYQAGAGKDREQILNDVWHALFAFDDAEWRCRWAREKLLLTPERAEAFAAISLPRDYASLSLNAINKILPFLRAGWRYDEAVFMSNLKAVLPAALYADREKRKQIEEDVAHIVRDGSADTSAERQTKYRRVADYLKQFHGVDERHLDRLYHPSMIENYPQVQPDAHGRLLLGSPRTSAVRNPMAMRALFRLRALVNELLREGKVDSGTKINIEFARGLNDANMRKAIERYQQDREKEHKKIADEIRTVYTQATGRPIEPTEDDILKYSLWKEQEGICLYTGARIAISDFLGENPAFDIEHTVPRSRGGDDSQRNKTLCGKRFNREVKQSRLPSELGECDAVMERIGHWADKIEELRKRIEGQFRKIRSATTKAEKDAAIQQRHYLKMHLDYWRGKYERFTMTEVPEGFSNRQGVDVGIIGKYARLYLKTVFDRIYTVKGATTAAYRRMWGLQRDYADKERANHVHHCIDAITIACIGREQYEKWTQYAKDEERYERGEGARPHCDKPWPTFTEDVKAVADELLVSHHTPDNMGKQSRRKLRVRGKKRRNEAGGFIYEQGDTARGALHQQTFYGAICRDGELKYVVRKSLAQLQESDIDKIVDEAVRQKIKAATEAVGFRKAIDTQAYTVWMNEEKRIPIRKVRVYTPGVKSPIPLKKQRDRSAKEYKGQYYVVNDSNYCMAIYEGTDKKGRPKRSFEIVNNLEAAKYFKKSADRTVRPDLVPRVDTTSGYPLKCLLKIGTMVLFYEHSAGELYECTKKELTKRLYKVIAMSQEGRVQFLFHQEARDSKAIQEVCGQGSSSFDSRNPAPKLRLSVSKFDMLVEGYDFDLSVTGEIRFKH